MLDAILNITTTLLGLSAALYVVVQPHPVLATMSLIFLAFITAIRWWSYGAFFFSLLLLLIYLGAVLVLFAFVVMTLAQKRTFSYLSDTHWNRYLLGLLSVVAYMLYPLADSESLASVAGYQDLSAAHLAPIILQHSEVLMQILGSFLLLAMLVAVMLLRANRTKEEAI